MKIYYNNKILNAKEKITIEDIQEIELKYHFTFPEEFKEHYLSYNGGEPEKYVFVDEDGDEYIIQQFIPIKGGNRDFDTTLRDLRRDGIIPDWLIPFAEEPSGDLYCFSIAEGSEGDIYLWYHEEVDDPDNSYSYLCDSLSEFINSMKEHY
ncbi:SMI1/KNR4 family protein [Geobacillus sp. FSL W8-0032]|uniref:Knr4/Smi1-like domain-containing protein n=1 Tax=Geobacillus icigianus TaxID=1430331 RepID=A0ABU6BFT5_9BACL|nr:SMI1/KNR4 family protein [Geobacillus icigianus]MEB3750761.1 hypothetical protein [Geobacillus icigianus]